MMRFLFAVFFGVVQVPVGMQLMARHMDEASLLKVGAALEAAIGFSLPHRVTQG